LAQMAQTLGESTAKERALIQIQPQTLKFLQDRIVADHIMLTLLAFEHRHEASPPLVPSRWLRRADNAHHG
jgi:hypothetical protein